MNRLLTAEDIEAPRAYEQGAVRIIRWYHEAEKELLGRSVALTNGAAGAVKALRLDELHGLMLTFEEHETHTQRYNHTSRQWHPVSTIRHF